MEEIPQKLEALEAGNLQFLGLDVGGATTATTTAEPGIFEAMEEEGELKIECSRPASIADLWALYPDEMRAETGRAFPWELTPGIPSNHAAEPGRAL